MDELKPIKFYFTEQMMKLLLKQLLSDISGRISGNNLTPIQVAREVVE